MGTRRRAWSGNPESRRFADAVPRWRDRRELRRRFRAVARALRAEDKQKVTHSLCRLASDHVPVTFVGRGRSGDRALDFADGTHVELAVHEGEQGLWHLRISSKRRPPYLRLVKPCLRHGWYRLHFFVAGQEDLMVRARVDDYEATDVCFRRADGRGPHGR